jgi:hypothetical protein
VSCSTEVQLLRLPCVWTMADAAGTPFSSGEASALDTSSVTPGWSNANYQRDVIRRAGLAVSRAFRTGMKVWLRPAQSGRSVSSTACSKRGIVYLFFCCPVEIACQEIKAKTIETRRLLHRQTAA